MIILCADDYGLAEGVSRGIRELVDDRRLSATSAMVTFERWPHDAEHLADMRSHVAIGLHLNLTLGKPLIATEASRVSHLNADGRFHSIGKLIRQAAFTRSRPGKKPFARFRRPFYTDALEAECHAQIAAFRDAVGALPDFIDGHQHVHVLRQVRRALLAAITQFEWTHPPLIRMPSNGAGFGRPRNQWGKRGVIAGLSAGMRDELTAANLPFNDTFSGFSSFELGSDYAAELRAALNDGWRCHLVMCHPGYGDAELAARGDPVVARRAEELAGIRSIEGLPERIWHPERESCGALNWAKATTKAGPT